MAEMLLTVDVVFASYESLKPVMVYADWLYMMHKMVGHLQNFVLLTEMEEIESCLALTI